MSKRRSERRTRLTLASVLALTFTTPAWSQEQPGDTCSPDNAIGRSGGTETSGKGFLLTCQSGVWSRIYESDANANLGVRQASPKAPLHIGGELIVGETTGLDCDADRKGGLRWNDTQHTIEMCDGATWKWITGSALAAGPDGAIQFNSSSALAGTSSFVYTSGGAVSITTTSASGQGLIVRSSPSQSGNLTEWRDAADSPLAFVTRSGSILAGDGSAAAPSLSFANDSNTGFYSYQDNLLGVVTGGTLLAGFGNNRINMRSGSSITWSDVSNPFTNAGGGSLSAGSGRTLSYQAGSYSTAFRLFNFTGTDSEFATMGFRKNANVFTIETEKTGTGSVRDIALIGAAVGIGTANPASTGAQVLKLDVEGPVGATAYCDSDGNNCFNPASGAIAAGPEGAVQFNSSSALTGTSSFVFTSTGNVGIGVQNPTYKLEINGEIRINNNQLGITFGPDNNLVRMYKSGTNQITVSTRLRASNFQGVNSADTTGMFFNTPNSTLSLRVNSSAVDRFHINALGLVGINTTSPAAQLHINANSSGSVKGVIIQGGESQIANLTEWQNSSGTILATFSSAGFLAIGKSTPQTALDVVGDIQYTGEIQDVSDRRLKENIVPLADQLVKITALQPVSFVMQGETKTELGLIAQDVEPLFPDLVRTASDEIGTKSINYIGLIAPLIRAVQEQQTEIQSQQQTIERLENQIDTLETRLRRLEERTGSSSP
ncbi:tail fiber domain-containing protein [Planctomicrobium sp. SH668]|uniref:tail fiber domain-containing protein n=1 Tax=Planctomicrobium sp. SH668 TaxID=3448126 RepID=UPI003F5B6EF7